MTQPRSKPSPRAAIAVGAVALAACVLGSATPARAQSDPAAERHYQRAMSLYEAGRLDEAVQALDAAIALDDSPVFYCNRGAFLVRLKRARPALDDLRTCDARYAIEDPAERAQLRAQIEGLSAAVEHIRPNAQRRADAVKRAAAVAIAPPKTTPPQDPDTPPDAAPLDTTRLAAWGTAGLAAVSLGTALGLDLATQSTIQEYEDVAAEGNARQRYDTLSDTIQGRRVWIGVLTGAGVAAALTSAVLFWTSGDADASAAPASVTIAPSDAQGGAVLGVQGRF